MLTRKFLIILGLVFVLGGIVATHLPSLTVHADEIDDIEKQKDDLQHLLDLSAAATTPLEGAVKDLQSRISKAQADIKAAQLQSTQIAKTIDQRESDLAGQYSIFSFRVASEYKRKSLNSPLLIFLSSSNAADLTRDLQYRAAIAAQNNQLIHETGAQIQDLEKQKTDLVARQQKLAGLSADLDKQSVFFKTQIQGAKAYQSELAGKIAALSARQQSILAEKSGTFQTAVGDVPLADDAASQPGYNPGFSPAFAAFSFGAPHFEGLSQYGAFGRAQSGQSAEDILHAYYGGGIEIKKDYDTNIQIDVQGYGKVDIETYVKRIYEMPSSWGDQGGMEALKAQAVAARSYALASTNNGASSICATESCQVYKNSNKGGKWEEAVNATKGWVLQTNGKPFFAKYASTSGGYQESYTSNGYSTPAFWDTKNGREGWTSQAYEKIAGSPWFYKGWYKTRTGDSCGKSSPWLTSQEMADVINAWVVLVKHGQSDDRVAPIGSCWGGKPYSLDDLKNKAGGDAVSSVSNVSVSYGTNGVTASVIFQTDKGSITINGNDFYKVFNLRAPGRISLKSGLYNIEHK